MRGLDGMTPGEVAEFGRSPLRKFEGQRFKAAVRGIGWELTFAQWWTIWRDSGKYRQRGVKRWQYVMARKWDTGPYAVGNVEVQTQAENMETVRLRRQFRRVGMKTVRLVDYTNDIDRLIENEEDACNF